MANLPADQLLRGYEVEKEHTDKPTTRLKIAADHVRENKAYYTKLDIMENTPLSRLQSLRKCMGSKLQKSNAVSQIELQDVPSKEHAFHQKGSVTVGDKTYHVTYSRPHGTKDAIWDVKQYADGNQNHTGFEWGVGYKNHEKTKQSILRAINKLHNKI